MDLRGVNCAKCGTFIVRDDVTNGISPIEDGTRAAVPAYNLSPPMKCQNCGHETNYQVSKFIVVPDLFWNAFEDWVKGSDPKRPAPTTASAMVVMDGWATAHGCSAEFAIARPELERRISEFFRRQ